MKHLFPIVLGVAVMTAAAAEAQTFDITQVPANAKPTDNPDANIKATNRANNGDYQKQIMSDPSLNDRARAEAVMDSGNDSAGKDEAGANLDAVKGTAADTKSASSATTPQMAAPHLAEQPKPKTEKPPAAKIAQEKRAAPAVSAQAASAHPKNKKPHGKKTAEPVIEQVAPAK